MNTVIRSFLYLFSLLTLNVSVQAQQVATSASKTSLPTQEIAQKAPSEKPLELVQPKTEIVRPAHQPTLVKEHMTGAERRAPLIQAVVTVYKALKKGPQHPEGIWDAAVLEKDVELKVALTEYAKGKRGQLAKSLNLSEMTAAEIHQLLISKGFKHEQIQVPLRSRKTAAPADVDAAGNASGSFKMDIYVHEDGSLIRVKPEGIPRAARAPFHFPHYIKSVLLSLKPICEGQVCQLDTSFKNEAFKITEEGDPVPKGPRADFGLRFLYAMDQKRERLYQVDTLMRLVHPTLVAAPKAVTLH